MSTPVQDLIALGFDAKRAERMAALATPEGKPTRRFPWRLMGVGALLVIQGGRVWADLHPATHALTLEEAMERQAYLDLSDQPTISGTKTFTDRAVDAGEVAPMTVREVSIFVPGARPDQRVKVTPPSGVEVVGARVTTKSVVGVAIANRSDHVIHASGSWQIQLTRP